MIEVRSLTHRYDGTPTPSVDDISFSIETGTIFGFLGPSGAGKSTTQALMTGLLRIRSGEVAYDGVSISKQGRSFYNKVGLSFEHPNVFGKLTGFENLNYHAGLYSTVCDDSRRLLDAVGLTDAADRRTSTYSKGMKQRLVFARSLVNKPSILFLDEPTSGLDPATADRIKEIIRTKRREGCTIFLTTHNMQTADELSDMVAFLNDGKVVAMDTPRELKLKYGDRSVAVEHRSEGDVVREVLFPERNEDAQRIKSLIDLGTVETIHSQEATLEEIFIRLTGRGLR